MTELPYEKAEGRFRLLIRTTCTNGVFAVEVYRDDKLVRKWLTDGGKATCVLRVLTEIQTVCSWSMSAAVRGEVRAALRGLS